MTQHSYYTAIGHYRLKQTTGGERYPVVVCCQREYEMDPQEMILWTCLTWRLLDLRQAERQYEKLAADLLPAPHRTFENCLDRLVLRGLVASGTGETGMDALYNLLSELYVVPVTKSFPLRVSAFLKMVLAERVPVSKAARVFRIDRHSRQEREVMALSRQALLSTAELIKCVENHIADVSSDTKLLSALYGDQETTSDNIGYAMRCAGCMQQVIAAISNLYLRQQILFERI